MHSEPVDVSISRHDWQFVLDELDRWSQVGEPDTEMNEALGAVIETALTSG